MPKQPTKLSIFFSIQHHVLCIEEFMFRSRLLKLTAQIVIERNKKMTQVYINTQVIHTLFKLIQCIMVTLMTKIHQL